MLVESITNLKTKEIVELAVISAALGFQNLGRETTLAQHYFTIAALLSYYAKKKDDEILDAEFIYQ